MSKYPYEPDYDIFDARPDDGEAVVEWKDYAETLEFILKQERKRRQWIPVEERLPEEGEQVYVWVEQHGEPCSATAIRRAYYMHGRWSDMDGITLHNVTHWMPLPEGPQ